MQSEHPWCIIEVKSKHFPVVFKKKVMEIAVYFTKTQFSTKSIFFLKN